MSGKKVSKTKKAKEIINDADPKHYFYLCDGTVVKNVLELSKCIEKMRDEVFSYHVNDVKNDFSNWIRDVYNDDKLAKRMLETTDKDKTQIILLKAIIEKFR
jgi:hypothetical protein